MKIQVDLYAVEMEFPRGNQHCIFKQLLKGNYKTK